MPFIRDKYLSSTKQNSKYLGQNKYSIKFS